jgi:hypothetical protein
MRGRMAGRSMPIMHSPLSILAIRLEEGLAVGLRQRVTLGLAYKMKFGITTMM